MSEGVGVDTFYSVDIHFKPRPCPNLANMGLLGQHPAKITGSQILLAKASSQVKNDAFDTFQE